MIVVCAHLLLMIVFLLPERRLVIFAVLLILVLHMILVLPLLILELHSQTTVLYVGLRLTIEL
jgi:hypothetical protein